MEGDDRSRFCGLCQLNVYNVEGLSREEALDLIGTSEGRLCLRLARRSDGTILTKDCPVGRAGVRRRLAYALVFGCVALMTGLASAATIRRGEERTSFREKCEEVTNTMLDKEPIATWLGRNQMVMGEMAVPVLTPPSVTPSGSTSP